jgi:hypothetical protein
MSMRTRKAAAGIVISVLVILGLSACASTPSVQVAMSNPAVHFPPTPTTAVRVLYHAPATAAGQQPIATLRLDGSPGQTEIQLVSILLRRAADLGANILWVQKVVRVDNENAQPIHYNPSGGMYQQGNVSYLALRIYAEAIRLP